MGFFDKLKKITTNLFGGFTEADEAFFEELEETLILADLGMDTALEALRRMLRLEDDGMRRVRLTEGLRRELSAMLLSQVETSLEYGVHALSFYTDLRRRDGAD